MQEILLLYIPVGAVEAAVVVDAELQEGVAEAVGMAVAADLLIMAIVAAAVEAAVQ